MGPGGPGGPGGMGGGRSFGGPGGMGPPPGGNMNGRSYNANNPPGSFTVPNAGNTSGDPRQGGTEGGGGGDDRARGLGAIASGVSTPMDKYGNARAMEQARRPGGGYGDRRSMGFNRPPNPRFDGPGGPRGGPGGVGGGRPDNLRYEERDYGEYVTNLRSNSRGPPNDGGGPPRGGDYRDLEDEVEKLRKENALLKRSCQDLMNNFNELSNRLFDVDESLKKVAKVFPDEDEMESLEWLLRR